MTAHIYNALEGGVAPGAPILVGDERAGISCFVRMDEAPHLLTCGHVFPPNSEGMAVYDTSTNTKIAHLSQNFLDKRKNKVDVALCELTDEGIALAKEAHQNGVPTFCSMFLEDLHFTPEERVLFWPISGGDTAIETVVIGYPTSMTFSGTYWDNQQLSDLLKLPLITSGSDSGSVLLFFDGNRNQFLYVGFCNGGEHSSYFTPIASALEKISAANQKKEVYLWLPDSH